MSAMSVAGPYQGEAAIHLRRQLLEWIDERPRPYAEILDAWRTSCPRLSIWEDACIDGLIDCTRDRSRIVSLSAAGRAWLANYSISSSIA